MTSNELQQPPPKQGCETPLSDTDRRIDAAVELAVRPYRAALVQTMEHLHIHEIDLPIFAVDALPREAIELRKMHGSWHISRPLHVSEEAGS